MPNQRKPSKHKDIAPSASNSIFLINQRINPHSKQVKVGHSPTLRRSLSKHRLFLCLGGIIATLVLIISLFTIESNYDVGEDALAANGESGQSTGADSTFTFLQFDGDRPSGDSYQGDHNEGRANGQELSAAIQNAGLIEALPWNLTLVNRWVAIPDDWQSTFINLTNGERIDARIIEPLQALFNSARAAGFQPMVASGFRDQTLQSWLFDAEWERQEGLGFNREEAYQRTLSWVAQAGHSEHHLGLAIDASEDGFLTTEVTPFYQWLMDNAHHYGFILRYPKGKIDITGVNFEPWHYRYVGIEVATEIFAQGITLEEYLFHLIDVSNNATPTP